MARHKTPLKKKLSVLIQLIILAGAAAWVAYVVIERGYPKESDKQQWTQQDGFLAISYGGLSRNKKGPHLPREEFQKHLEALGKKGFESVTTEDIEAFYRDGTPLPDRAVYIMFEGGRKDSAIFGQEGLVQTGMRAAMFVSTGFMSEWNRTFMKKAQIGTLGRSRFWDVESSGHQMYAESHGESDKDRRYFLTDYLRDATGKRSETLSEYRNRAENDYQESARIIETVTQEKPRAYLFVPSNTINNSMPEELSEVNRELLNKKFSFAFTREGIAYNSARDNPYTLTRLRVHSSTTPEQLIDLVEGWLPNFRHYRYSGDESLHRWHTNYGNLVADESGLALESDINLNGFSWLTGSDNWRNVVLSARLSLQNNTETSIYLRYMGKESYVRVAFRPDQIRVQERIKEQGLSTLATAGVPGNTASADRTQDIRIELINNRLALFVDAVPVFSNPLPLQSELPGVLAIGVNPYGDNDDEQSTKGTHRTAGFGELDAVPLMERWKKVGTESEVNQIKSAQSTDYSGILVDVSSVATNRELVAELLRAADSGWIRVAVLPSGSIDAEVLNTDIPGLPEGLAEGLWNGIALTPGKGKQLAEMTGDILSFKERGVFVGLCLDNAQAKEASLEASHKLPVDFLLLPDDLDAASVTGLKRRYSNLFFESNGNTFSKRQ